VADYSKILAAHRRSQLAEPIALPRGTHRFFATELVPLPVEKVFPFFSEASNLEAITPPELRFRILTPAPVQMREGALIDYQLKLHGVGFRWRTRIAHWDPPHGFVDEQLKGPYAFWHHTHNFYDEGGKTRMDDEVLYRLPLWPLGEVAYPWVSRQVERIFAYRRRKIRQLLGLA
jgi:ligand-binding SRPBCC domain-containing protein